MKSKRQMMIKNLIETEEIKTQGELTQKLSELGIEVTQATISRDIKELGLIKIPSDDGNYKYGLTTEHSVGDGFRRARRIFAEFVTSIARSFNLIVIKSAPGTANTVGAAIDMLNWPEIMGTVAGDDSVLVILSDGRELGQTHVDLTKMEQTATLIEDKLNELRG